jgi:hypothetical protein
VLLRGLSGPRRSGCCVAGANGHRHHGIIARKLGSCLRCGCGFNKSGGGGRHGLAGVSGSVVRKSRIARFDGKGAPSPLKRRKGPPAPTGNPSQLLTQTPFVSDAVGGLDHRIIR